MSLGECLLIALVALVVIKPEQWPTVIRAVAKCFAHIRKFTQELQQQAEAVLDEPVNKMNHYHESKDKDSKIQSISSSNH